MGIDFNDHVKHIEFTLQTPNFGNSGMNHFSERIQNFRSVAPLFTEKMRIFQRTSASKNVTRHEILGIHFLALRMWALVFCSLR